jgi:hypothetical protein
MAAASSSSSRGMTYETDSSEPLDWFDYTKVGRSDLVVIIHPNPEKSAILIKKIKSKFDFNSGDTFSTDPWKFKASLGDECKAIDQCTSSLLTNIFGRQSGNFPDKPPTAKDREILSTLDDEGKMVYLKQLTPLHHLPRGLLKNLSEDSYNDINSYILIPDSYLILHSGTSPVGLTGQSASSSSSSTTTLVPEDDEEWDSKMVDLTSVMKMKELTAVGDDRGLGKASKIWSRISFQKCLYQLGKSNSLLRIIAVHSVNVLPPKLLAMANCIFVFARDDDELKKVHSKGKMSTAIPSWENFAGLIRDLDSSTGLVFQRTNRILVDTNTGDKKIYQKTSLWCTTDITRNRHPAASGEAASSYLTATGAPAYQQPWSLLLK